MLKVGAMQSVSVEELLAEHERWKADVRALFVNTRSATGMTQSTFAEKIGTSQSYVNEIEHGKKTPSSGTLAKLRSIREGETHAQDKGQS